MSSDYGKVRTLSTPSGDLSISIVDKGLHVLSLKYKSPQSGLVHDVVIGSDDPAKQLEGRRFMHSVVGRYCNRLPLEEITFPAPDSGSLKFTPQQFGGPGTSLHGGPSEVGWDQKLFKSIAPKEATLFSASEKKTLEKAPAAGVWVYESPDGEGGYPGRIRFEFAVVVDEQEEQPVLAFVYRAKLLDGEACPINLTHHWGFNLDASTDGQSGPTAIPTSVNSHNLIFNASRTLELEPKTALPTGKLESVEGTPKDFRTSHGGKTIGDGYPQGGYDDYWVFDKDAKSTDFVIAEGDEADRVGEVLKASGPVQATLSSNKSGLSLDFASNQSGIQAWSGHGGYDGSDARKNSHGGQDKTGINDGYVEGCAIALEFHEIYGSWLHPELEKIGWNTILRKGEVYNNWVKVVFKST